MKLDVMKFGIAWAAASAVLWLACSLVVYSMPGLTMSMSRNMMHSNMEHWAWSFSIGGVLVGLLLWALFAGLFGALVAWIYNKMTGNN